MHALAAALIVLTQGLADDEFKKLHAELKQPPEGWLTIPWTVSVTEARERAIREKKPIFLWSEAGNPLGCT